MKNLIIIGAGGFAREVYNHAKLSHGYNRDWRIKGFLDGDIKLDSASYSKLALPVLGDVYNYQIEPDDVFICAFSGDLAARRKIIQTVENRGGKFINLIHKTAIIQDNVRLGVGVIICYYVGIGDHATIGDHVAINGHSAIGHDAIIGKNTCIMSFVDIMGNTTIGENVYFASGSRILPHGALGDNAYIGAGSVVLKTVKAGAKVFGVPAVEM